MFYSEPDDFETCLQATPSSLVDTSEFSVWFVRKAPALEVLDNRPCGQKGKAMKGILKKS